MNPLSCSLNNFCTIFAQVLSCWKRTRTLLWKGDLALFRFCAIVSLLSNWTIQNSLCSQHELGSFGCPWPCHQYLSFLGPLFVDTNHCIYQEHHTRSAALEMLQPSLLTIITCSKATQISHFSCLQHINIKNVYFQEEDNQLYSHKLCVSDIVSFLYNILIHNITLYNIYIVNVQ